MTPERRLDILRCTRRLIADPRRWGQGTLMQHRIIDKLMMRPPSLCLMGAVMHSATGGLAYSAEVYDIIDYLSQLVPEKHSAHSNQVTAYNDHHTHSDVMFLLDAAIFHTQTEIDKPWPAKAWDAYQEIGPL